MLIRKHGAELVVSVPKRVADTLGAGAGDVLNFTELPDGAIEVWLVKKGTYASLDDMAESSGRKAAKKTPGGRNDARDPAERRARWNCSPTMRGNPKTESWSTPCGVGACRRAARPS